MGPTKLSSPIDPAVYAAAEAQTSRAFAAIVEAHPWVESVPKKALAITRENAGQRSKLTKFIRLATELNEAVAPQSQCAVGCHECCRISVSMTSLEAELIGKAIGVLPAKPAKAYLVTGEADWSAEPMRFFGVPCSFLEKGQCSIYEHRPVACRTHTNLGDARFCSTEIEPDQSYVSGPDLRSFYLLMTTTLLDSPVADVRDFFPNGRNTQA